MSERQTPSGFDPRSENADKALIDEFCRVGPHWLGPEYDKARLASVFERMHTLPPDQRPTALCLSGGGIRSATFGLGVLQAFARSGRLERFDYLSSVSGGGYIASWLMAWLRRERGRWDKVTPVLADGVHAPPEDSPRRRQAGTDTGEDPVSRLRAYSNYLSPMRGLSADGLSLAAIFLRNLLLNLAVWLPLLLAVTLLPRAFLAALRLPLGGVGTVVAAVLAALLVGTAIACTVFDLPGPRERVRRRSHFLALCFVPLLLAAVCIALAGAWYGQAPATGRLWLFMLAGVVVHLLGIAFGVFWRWRSGIPLREGMQGLAGTAVVLLIGMIGGAMLWLALQAPPQSDGVDGPSLLLWATASVPAVLGSYWLALSIYAGLTRPVTDEGEREWWARATGWWLLASLVWVLLFGVTVHLPLWLFDRFGGALPDGAELGLGGTLLGIATALGGYWSKNGATIKTRAGGLVKSAGLRLLDAMAIAVIVLLLLALSLTGGLLLEHCRSWMPGSAVPSLCPRELQPEADFLRQQAALARSAAAAADARAGEGLAFEHVLLYADFSVIVLSVFVLVLMASVISKVIGANTFSLHGMYGNRLVRAYLGATRVRRRPHSFTGFDPDDQLPLDDRQEGGDPRPPIRPFHVINIALNLVAPSGRRLAWQQRRAASFTATPLRCGADGLGYVPCWAYGGQGGMSLGRALTISGAAASPNMGYHSSAAVTFVMTLFNVRLGWWLPNPSKHEAKRWHHDEPGMPFATLLSEALGRTTDNRRSIHLSDGGHFENLGLYEMVRRRCHRIVVVDATCDPKFEYADLHDSVRKIRVDLGIMVELPDTLPGPDRSTPHARLTLGRIRYSARDGNPPDEDGWLYLIKPRLVGNEPPELGHYVRHAGGGDSPFPHQSTADQFFDETQFESYRLLGMLSAEQCFPVESVAGDSRISWPQEVPAGFAAKAAPPEAASKDHPARGAAGSSGLWDGLQQLGGGAALATALTVGGTLGVVGTIGLSPGEVRLSDADRALLKEGVNLHVKGGGMPPEGPDRPRPDAAVNLNLAGQADTAALAEAARRLAAAAEALLAGAGERGGITTVAAALTEVRQTVNTLGTVIARQSEAGQQTTALIQRIDLLVAQLKPQPDLALLHKELAEVTKALRDLRDTVDAASPRRNVRGEGGSR